MKILSNKYLLFISRIVLSGVFIFAAVEKISDPAGFAEAVYNYRLFPQVIINFIAVVIPWIELTAGILLLFNNRPKENAFLLNILLLLFIIIVTVSMARGLNINCGCFGTTSGSKVGWQKIGENVLLFLLGIHIIYFTDKIIKHSEPS